MAIYQANSQEIGHFTVVYLVAKHLICSEVITFECPPEVIDVIVATLCKV